MQRRCANRAGVSDPRLLLRRHLHTFARRKEGEIMGRAAAACSKRMGRNNAATAIHPSGCCCCCDGGGGILSTPLQCDAVRPSRGYLQNRYTFLVIWPLLNQLPPPIVLRTGSYTLRDRSKRKRAVCLRREEGMAGGGRRKSGGGGGRTNRLSV